MVANGYQVREGKVMVGEMEVVRQSAANGGDEWR